ncbi:MAG: AAA family ATPase [Bacteroidales bacterium]|nr:AAA family ATPase [Bacteroidales bacterium]
MHKRTLLESLRVWKNKDGRKPLVLRGARQVGKTTLVMEFAKEFNHFISLNLEHADDAALFNTYSRVDDMLRFLFLKNGIARKDASSILIFIDEIQENAKAVGFLRFFYEQAPWLHVVAARSRLQSLVKEHISFPVGRVEYLTLRPFSFQEYLAAIKGEMWTEALLDYEHIDAGIHGELIKDFNTYALVGGMPEAVVNFAKNRDIMALAPIYQSLRKGYVEDLERYGKNEKQIAVMRHILNYGWAQAGEAITFAKFAGSDYTSTAVHEAFDVLQKAFILSLDYPITATKAPAIPALTRSPKLIWVDAGLVNFFADIQLEYLQNKDLLDTWRGHAAEQIVAQELRVLLDKHYKEEQHFWVRDKKGADAEIDFVWPTMGKIVPIEVKAGTNSHLRSIHAFVNNCERQVSAIRVWSGEFSVQETVTPAPSSKPYRLINVPFYLVSLLDKIIEQHC